MSCAARSMQVCHTTTAATGKPWTNPQTPKDTTQRHACVDRIVHMCTCNCTQHVVVSERLTTETAACQYMHTQHTMTCLPYCRQLQHVQHMHSPFCEKRQHSYLPAGPTPRHTARAHNTAYTTQKPSECSCTPSWGVPRCSVTQHARRQALVVPCNRGKHV